MPTPSEHKTVQARILEYAEAIGWTIVSREEAERRRGFDPHAPLKERFKGCSLFFDSILDAKVREFNPRYAEAESVLLSRFRIFYTNIYGNGEFVEHLRKLDLRKLDLMNYNNKLEAICCNNGTPSQLVSVKDYA